MDCYIFIFLVGLYLFMEDNVNEEIQNIIQLYLSIFILRLNKLWKY